jgi:hypothetical protein
MVCRVIPAGCVKVEEGKCFVKKLGVAGVSPTRHGSAWALNPATAYADQKGPDLGHINISGPGSVA